MLIVTHKNPDLDAIASVWLLKRFAKEFSEAQVEFVNAGSTYKDRPADEDNNIVHVDTGLGCFDHHETDERTCAAKKVFDFLAKNKNLSKQKKALDRLIKIVVEDDHFDDCYWPEADNDRYNFFLTGILDGLKKGESFSDSEVVKFGMVCLDGILASLKLKIEAEEAIDDHGFIFTSRWGQALAIESKNDEVLKVAQKQGYILAARKDSGGMVRIKAQPKSKVNLTETYQALKKLDNKATWFLHASKKMLLNGSYRNPDMVPSKLGLAEVIKVLK